MVDSELQNKEIEKSKSFKEVFLRPKSGLYECRVFFLFEIFCREIKSLQSSNGLKQISYIEYFKSI